MSYLPATAPSRLILFALLLALTFAWGCRFQSPPLTSMGLHDTFVPVAEGETAVSAAPHISLGSEHMGTGGDLRLSHQFDEVIRVGAEGHAGWYQGLGTDNTDGSLYRGGRAYGGFELAADPERTASGGVYVHAGYLWATDERQYAQGGMSINGKVRFLDTPFVIGAGVSGSLMQRLFAPDPEPNQRQQLRGYYFSTMGSFLIDLDPFFVGLEGGLGLYSHESLDIQLRTGVSGGTRF